MRNTNKSAKAVVKHEPYAPDGEILPSVNDLYAMSLQVAGETFNRHNQAHALYLQDGVTRGLLYAEKQAWSNTGTHLDYRYVPIGMAGHAYLDANENRYQWLIRTKHQLQIKRLAAIKRGECPHAGFQPRKMAA